jgi:hypothetical protein
MSNLLRTSRQNTEEVLLSRFAIARQGVETRRAEFDALIDSIDQDLPNRNGAQRIRDAGSKLLAARETLAETVSVLRKFLHLPCSSNQCSLDY